MAEEQIIWSGSAKKQFYAVLEKMLVSNPGKEKAMLFSSGLFRKIKSELTRNTGITLFTSDLNVYAMIFGTYMILYERIHDNIVVHYISLLEL
ncbi:MAG TPA: hypothetical protein VK213_13730 [Bacteroidales bacterium]|nr:hypothetical protein [Bacteroidales bacterium]